MRIKYLCYDPNTDLITLPLTELAEFGDQCVEFGREEAIDCEKWLEHVPEPEPRPIDRFAYIDGRPVKIPEWMYVSLQDMKNQQPPVRR